MRSIKARIRSARAAARRERASRKSSFSRDRGRREDRDALARSGCREASSRSVRTGSREGSSGPSRTRRPAGSRRASSGSSASASARARGMARSQAVERLLEEAEEAVAVGQGLVPGVEPDRLGEDLVRLEGAEPAGLLLLGPARIAGSSRRPSVSPAARNGAAGLSGPDLGQESLDDRDRFGSFGLLPWRLACERGDQAVVELLGLAVDHVDRREDLVRAGRRNSRSRPRTMGAGRAIRARRPAGRAARRA